MKKDIKVRFLCFVLLSLPATSLSLAGGKSIHQDSKYGCAVQYNGSAYIYSISSDGPSFSCQSDTSRLHQILLPEPFKPLHYYLAVQHDGFMDQIWFIVGQQSISEKNDCWRYDIMEGKWSTIEKPPFDKIVLKVLPFGQSDIAVWIDGGEIYNFNTIVNRWHSLGSPNFGKPLDEITSSDLESLGRNERDFGIINYATLILFLLSVVGIGLYFSRNKKNTDDFFRAGGRIPSWAAGLSIFGAQLSAITYIGMPGKAYSSDWRYFLGNMSIFFIAAPVAALIFIPYYRRLNISTAYEYLEKRFNFSVRLIASLIYIVTQLVRIAIVLFLPALALSVVTGMDVRFTIILIGVLTTAYTTLGGIEAVIWVNVVEVVVLLTGALLALSFMVFDIGGDIVNLTEMSFMQGKFSLGQLKLSFSSATFLVVLLSLPAFICPYISDQTVVQRYLTTKEEKDAKKALWVNAWMVIPATLIFFGIGTLLYMFYFSNPEKLDPGMSNDSILIWFIFNELPSGVCGLVIASIFAAAMSSLDSTMNSVSTAIVSDIIIRFRPKISECTRVIFARLFTVLVGAFGTVTALVMTAYDIKSFWDCLSMLIGPFAGALGGLFLLAACTKKCNSVGGLAGVILGVSVVYVIQFNTSIHFFLYNGIAIAVTCATGYIISIMTGSNTKDIDNLTLYTMSKNQKNK